MLNYQFITENKTTQTAFLNFLNDWNNSSAFIIQKTSGSTGTPKSIKIPKEKMKASAQMTIDFFSLNEKQNALLCISPAYIGGKMLVVRAILAKMKLFIAETKANPLSDLKINIDFCALTPYQVEHILRETPEQLNLIHKLIIGGAPVSSEMAKELAKFDCEAYSTFGMTETVSHIALKKLVKNNDTPFNAIGDVHFSTNDNQQLIIHSKKLGVTEMTTNDVVELLSPNSFHWLGRKDFVVNSGGIKLFPEKIEEKIRPILTETLFFLIGVKDSVLGEKLIGFCTRNIENNELEQIHQKLGKYEVPKQWITVKRFELTSSGKIDRLKTKMLYYVD